MNTVKAFWFKKKHWPWFLAQIGYDELLVSATHLLATNIKKSMILHQIIATCALETTLNLRNSHLLVSSDLLQLIHKIPSVPSHSDSWVSCNRATWTRVIFDWIPNIFKECNPTGNCRILRCLATVDSF